MGLGYGCGVLRVVIVVVVVCGVMICVGLNVFMLVFLGGLLSCCWLVLGSFLV